MNRNSRLWTVLLVVVLAVVPAFGAPLPARAADATFTVTPLSPDWAFSNDNGTSGDWTAGFQRGPSTPPLGSGSVYIHLSSKLAGIAFGTQKYQGTLLSAVQALSYSTYSNQATAAISFQINYDPDLTAGAADPWYGRLVYEPYLNGTVTPDTWQNWDMIDSGAARWWATPNGNSPVDETCPQSAPCTWADLIAAYPNIGIRNDPSSGIMVKAGSGWDPFEGNVDNLTIQIAGNSDTYNFEPLSTIYVDDSWAGVTPGEDPDGDGPAVKFGTDSFATIQEGIDAIASGGTVRVAAGTYTERILLNTRLSLLGAGSASTIITNPGGGDPAAAVVQVSASGVSALQPLLVKDIGIHPMGVAGIGVGLFTQSTGTSVSYLRLENVDVEGTNANPCTEQERGLYVDLTSSLLHLAVKNSSFNNLTYGWYFQKEVSADASTVQYVSVQGTTFSHNNLKGIYAEKLSDAVFTDLTVSGNGFSTAADLEACPYFLPFEAGVDLNLKAGTYQNLSFIRPIVTNNALGGAREGVGLAVKARDDGATYGPFPATLNNVQVLSGTFAGNERGIRAGEPGKNNAGPTNVGIHGSSIAGNIQTYSGSDGSTYGGVVNQAVPLVNATNNWWGSASGPGPVGPGTGDNVSTNVDYDPWCLNSLCLNDPPVITEGASVKVTMSEDGSPVPFSLTLHATDPNWGDTLSWSISTPPAHGVATASGTGSSKTIGYTPELDFHSVDSFGVQVSDGHGGTDTITVQVIVVRTRLFYSSASQDGWIRESTETSRTGSRLDFASSTLIVGDSALDQQFRSILSFNTAGLPDDAVITSATLKIKKALVMGTDPFTTHGSLLVDIRTGSFSNNPALQPADFNATSSKPAAFVIKNTPVAGWYSRVFPAASLAYISRTNLTQFRLRFLLDDNDDLSADYVRFFSGNTLVKQPVLLIQYYEP